MSQSSKLFVVMLVCAFAAANAQAGTLSFKFNLGGTYLIGGDYNKTMNGWRDYEQTVLEPTETFTDNLKKLGLGFQGSVEAIYELSPRLGVGIEAGYLGATVTSGFSRTWNDYHMTETPRLSGVPLLLNVHYTLPLSGPWKLQVTAGGGILLTHLELDYNYENLTLPYHGTWIAENQTTPVFKAGFGLEYALSNTIALTFDLFGRYAEIKDLTGEYSGVFNGSPYSGTATAYYYDLVGTYPWLVLYADPPSSANAENVRTAVFSFSGLSALFGVRITI